MGARKIFTVDHRLCVGCKQCELVCSLTKTGAFNPYRARIRVTRNPAKGNYLPIICYHCKEPRCQKACPEDALKRDLNTGAVVLDESLCTGCRACVVACPFGAIQVDPDGDILKCDLCGGDPTCVKYCSERPANSSPLMANPEGAKALQYVEPHQVTYTKRYAQLSEQF
jgi:Fe-S-cluster-containing dehydrogenase component